MNGVIKLLRWKYNNVVIEDEVFKQLSKYNIDIKIIIEDGIYEFIGKQKGLFYYHVTYKKVNKRKRIKYRYVFLVRIIGKIVEVLKIIDWVFDSIETREI